MPPRSHPRTPRPPRRPLSPAAAAAAAAAAGSGSCLGMAAARGGSNWGTANGASAAAVQQDREGYALAAGALAAATPGRSGCARGGGALSPSQLNVLP